MGTGHLMCTSLRGGLRAQCPGHVHVICVAEAEAGGAGAFLSTVGTDLPDVSLPVGSLLTRGLGRGWCPKGQMLSLWPAERAGQAGSTDRLGHGRP